MSSSDSTDYEEMETESQVIPCVFCDEKITGENKFIEHNASVHGIDFVELFARMNVDVFHIIKMMNYLRKMKPAPPEFINLCTAQSQPWSDESFLEPTIPNDPLLVVDFDDLIESRKRKLDLPNNSNAGGDINMEKCDDVALLREQLKLAHTRIAQMQKTARVILSGNDTNGHELTVEKLKVSEDIDYIDSYSHFGIHEEMLQDTVRTLSYRDAIAKNRSLIEGKTCLDVGCGTGILSMFLAREGGAAKVIGVDFSEVIYSAMDIVRQNNLQGVVHLKKGKLEDIEIEPVDVIVSEWMGYFLIFENMMDTVISARDKHLKPGGILLPNKANIFLCASDEPRLHEKHVSFWEDVYGFKMSCMKKQAVQDALVEVGNAQFICTDNCLIKHFDLNTCTVQDTMLFSSLFKLNVIRETNITAICGHFNTVFDLPSAVVLDTSPLETPTHWKQTFFLLPETIHVASGGSLCGTIVVKRNTKNRRGLEVEIQIDGYDKKLKYTV